jgi:hypothetical protein
LADLLPTNLIAMGTDNALLLGAYIVKQATEFIDGCGGKTQTMLIKRGEVCDIWDADRERFSNEKITALAQIIHECARNLFTTLIDSDAVTRELEDKIQTAKKQIQSFYGLPDVSSPTEP